MIRSIPTRSACSAASPRSRRIAIGLLAIEGTVPAPFDLPQGCRFHPRCVFADAACTAAGPGTPRARREPSRCLHPGAGGSAGVMSALLEVKGLTRHFDVKRGLVLGKMVGVVRAVDGISFTIDRGETLALVGESGCGKSTTARLVLRLIDPTAGTIYFEGTDITELRRRSAAPFAPSDADRIPGSVCLAEPAHDSGRDPGGAADRARYRRPRGTACAGEPVARTGRVGTVPCATISA